MPLKPTRVRLPDEMFNAAQALANRRRCSVAEIVRQGLAREIGDAALADPQARAAVDAALANATPQQLRRLARMRPEDLATLVQLHHRQLSGSPGDTP